jgi:putative addiction module CopG family antidote
MPSSLPADLAQFVQNELALGHYGSVDEVVCDGLRLLQSQRANFDALRTDIQAGIEQLDRGEGIAVKHSDLRTFLDEIASEVKAELGMTGQRFS